MSIKAVIWDLGGVIVRTEDFSSRDQLSERLGKTRHELEEIVFGGISGTQAQRGEIDIDQHWENVRRELSFSEDELKSFIDEFFTGDRVDRDLISFIRGLQANYKTALLSNAFSNLRHFVNNVWMFADAFDQLIISAEVGIIKPDARIYQLALERLDVEAYEAVFIDDFRHNVEGARTAGLHAIHFLRADQAVQELQDLLNSRST